MPAGVASPARACGGCSRSEHAPQGSRTGCTRTCCATRARPTCSPTELTFGWCRSSSGIPPSPPPSSTPRCRWRTSERPTSRHIRALPGVGGSNLLDVPPEASTVDHRALLEEERKELLAKLDELGLGGAGLTYDSNFADSSQVTAERGEVEALAATLRDTLEDVERALAKLTDGTYG